MTTSFYRGTVCGTPVTLALPALDRATADRFLASLHFAAFQPATCKGVGGDTATLAIRVEAVSAPPPAIRFDDPNNGFLREIAEGLWFQVNLAASDAIFSLQPAATGPALPLTLERIRSEIIHLLGLCTPALALHASCVATTPALQAAWIFCGPSGAGKTTISTVLLQTLPLVDQETVLLDISTTPPRLLNTPAAAAQPPTIAGLFQLQQAPRCAIASLSTSVFIAKNMTKPFSLHLPDSLERRLDKLTRLTGQIKPRELQFNLNAAEVLTVLQQA